MRLGQNPAKLGLPAYQPHRLGAALLTYVPDQEGYFSGMVPVIQAAVNSLRANTGEPFDLLVFDNGSCQPVRRMLAELQEQGQIDWLVLSRHNLGKTGALNWIFASLPNELICYADGDVFFRPGWFQASLAVLEGFRAAGMVAAQPCFFDVLKGEGKAKAGLPDDPLVQVETVGMPAGIVEEYNRGVAASPEAAARNASLRFTRYTRLDTGVQALEGASHMQFLARAEVLRRILPLPAGRGLDSAEDRLLDERLDSLGCLHLATLDAHVFHIGNAIDEHAAREIAGLTPQAKPPKEAEHEPKLPALLRLAARWPGGRHRLRRLYNDLFQYFARENRP